MKTTVRCVWTIIFRRRTRSLGATIDDDLLNNAPQNGFPNFRSGTTQRNQYITLSENHIIPSCSTRRDFHSAEPNSPRAPYFRVCPIMTGPSDHTGKPLARSVS